MNALNTKQVGYCGQSLSDNHIFIKDNGGDAMLATGLQTHHYVVVK